MYLIEKIGSQNEKRLRIIFTIILLYTIVHFSYTGVYFPITHENLGQVTEEVAPLVDFLNGEEFKLGNPRQYGPFFILIMTYFMVFQVTIVPLHIALLIFQYLLVGSAFYLCYKSIFANKRGKRLAFYILLFIWLNYVPLLYILAVKNVEIWELFLICLAFVAYTQRKFFIVGFSFAAGMLTKFLPALFIFYFLFKNKKVFFWSLISLALIMGITHILFGPQIGFLYFPFLLKLPFGSGTWAATFYENTSLKGFVYKVFSGFTINDQLFFTLSAEEESLAFIVVSFFQIVLLAYLVWTAFRKKCSYDELMIQFSLVSIIMIILAPIAALEYYTLLLLAYSIGLYFILYKSLPNSLYICYGMSYLLIGNFIPLTLIIKFFPLKALNSYFGITSLTLSESYKAYCFPLLGVFLLAFFFMVLWHKKDLLKEESTE